MIFENVGGIILDAGLNPVFILGLGPVPAMGIAGSATASVLATLISVSVLVWQIYRRDITIRLRGEELRWLIPDFKHARPILAKGLPMGLSMIVMSASSLVMIGLINREGVDSTAAYGASMQLWNYLQMPAFAISSAVSAMVAQNIGAGRWDRISAIARTGLVVNLAMTGFLVLGNVNIVDSDRKSVV